MIGSLLEVLNIDNVKLNDLLETCYRDYEKEKSIFILDDQYDYFMDYVKKNLSVCIDYRKRKLE